MIFSILKEKCEIMTMKTHTCVCLFFQMLIFYRVVVVIFELDEASISSFVKFRLWSMTLKIMREFENQTTFFIKSSPKMP